MLFLRAKSNDFVELSVVKISVIVDVIDSVVFVIAAIVDDVVVVVIVVDEVLVVTSIVSGSVVVSIVDVVVSK